MSKKNDHQKHEIKKEFSPEITRNPFSWLNYVKVVGKSIKLEELLFQNYPEDTKQIKYWIALEAAQAEREGKSKEEITKLINKLYRQTAKHFGFECKKDQSGQHTSFYKDTRTWMKDIGENYDHGNFWREEYSLGEEYEFPSSTPEEKEYPRCGVPNCNNRGVYYDSKFERLCGNCLNFGKNRIKKGEADPYRNIEKDRTQDIKDARNSKVIKDNLSFWDMIHKHLNYEEWKQLWRWAKGVQDQINDKKLIKVRRIIISNLKILSFGERNYKSKNSSKKRLIFLHPECLECGEKYEIDVYQILQNRINFSYLCPRCGGFYSSHRLFRLQELIEKLISRELNYQSVVQKTDYSYGVLVTLVSIYRKKGLEGLAQKIGFPYFGTPAKNNDLDLLKKTEKHLQSSLHPDNFI